MSNRLKLSILIALFVLLGYQNNLLAEKLSLDHPLVAQALAFKDPQHPQAARWEELPLPIKCGTPAMIFVSIRRQDLPAQIREILQARPVLSFDFNTPGGHFRVHYDTSTTGGHRVYGAEVDVNPADGHPDYVNRTGEYLDYVWSYEVDSIGLAPPPTDEWYPTGGDSRYDVYLVGNLGGAFGLTQPDSFQAGNPQAYTSWIELRTSYIGFGYPDQYDPLKVTVAHEFFHSIQLGYDAYEPFLPDMSDYNVWWLEATAVWMEDVVFDEVNDYINYLSYFFRYPWLSLTAHDPTWQDWVRVYHMYASCVWPIYLSERFGAGPINTDIIREIWEGCAQTLYDNLLSATNEVLDQYYSDLNSAFGEFTIWNYFSGNLNESGYYSEGSYFPDLNDTMMVYDSYPVTVTSPTQPPEYLGANYVKFVPFDSTGGLRTNFSGAFIPWKVNMIGYSTEGQGGSHRVREMDLDDFWEGTRTFNDWNKYSEIVMIPAVVDTAYHSGTYNYSFSAVFDTSLTGPEPVQIAKNRPLRNGNLGESYLDTLIALDGVLPYNWTVEEGVVPPGLDLSASSGIIQGVPTAGGLYPIRVRVTDSSTPAYTDTARFSIYISQLPTEDWVGQSYPNPFIIGGASDKIYFPFDLADDGNVLIRVHTVAGEFIKEISVEGLPAESYRSRNRLEQIGAYWDGTNDRGEPVAGGVYLYYIKAAGVTKLKKLALIR
ncbi:MAG: MXAN_6640 family putative metalloprotease [Candidatus Zixiibacteriota bacterium]